MSAYPFDAVIFDLDGVITKTATTHSHAWKKMFDDYLKQRADQLGEAFVPFSGDDYLQFVDGKPRYEGVKSFLASRSIELDFGSPDDTTELETVCGLGNRKNQAFNEVLQKDGVEVYPSTVQLFHDLKEAGIHIGVASSSKNAEAVLTAAGLMDFVETRVDGVVSATLGLNGKPAPDIFVKAAENLGVEVHRSVVVEDASSGVAAGKNGNFGLVLGLARENNTEALKINGADVVVDDIEDFGFKEIQQWFETGINEDAWQIQYHDYNPEKERSREALLSIGNGFFATRGAMEESKASEHHYPGTYVAGLYNRLLSPVGDRQIENEDFVNAPNWLTVNFKIDDEPWIDTESLDIMSIQRTLDFRNGQLYRKMHIRDANNKETLIESSRVISMKNPHLAALKYTLKPLNYSGSVSLCSTLDATHENEGVSRYKSLESKHIETIEQGGSDHNSYLVCQTNQSHIQMAQAAKLSLRSDGETQPNKIGVSMDDGIVYSYIDVELSQGQVLELEKCVSFYTSHQFETSEVKQSAINAVEDDWAYDDILRDNEESWANIWQTADIKIEGDRLSQKLMRLHIYHLMVSGSGHNVDLDASITARGLHGEAYRGHIFWDELFILPFYNIHFPETAKSILMYRYRRLDAARDYAKAHGYQGAMFPWQSGSDGREETQVMHLNPVTGHWGPDHSSLQRHVSLAIAYNFWQYFHVSNDISFMEAYGAELYFEICRFWASKAQLDKKSGRYSIDEVMGPDEFHEMLPGKETPGLKDNAYTNLMVSWMFTKAEKLFDLLSEKAKENLTKKIELHTEELAHWKKIQSRLKLIVSEEGIISQYDGYFSLKELDWEYYRLKYKNVYRMDRLLKAEGKSADDYKVAKQADTLMTFYNLNKSTVDDLLELMDYRLPKDYLNKNLTYYLQRTSHGSTLSRVVHAQLAQIIGDQSLSWKLYQEALASDFVDIQGGTTAEGIHAGVMAGTIMTALSTYAGVDLRSDVLEVNPNLPANWKQIDFNFYFKGVNYSFRISNERVVIRADAETKLMVFGGVYTVGGTATEIYK